MAEPKKPFHEQVAENLIEQLKQGTAPWQRPWEPGNVGGMIPTNPTTGKRYKGINAIHLLAQGYGDNRWLTYKQAAALGAQVRKGQRGTGIQYWKFADEETKTDDAGRPVLDGNGQPVKVSVQLERPRVFYATVFNAEQIDGMPPRAPKPEHTWDSVERAEQILVASGAVITHAPGDRAFYRPSTDSITMPERVQFPSADRYYATALHELGHWTGHPSRLDRDLSHPFGSAGYAKEELRAEIASMILGDELGIGHDPRQHVAYVASWIKALQEDPLEIFRAAADAEKVHQFILAFEQVQQQEQTTEMQTSTDLFQLPGRLVDRLTENGIMSAPDAEATSALRDLATATDATRAIDLEAFQEASQKAFGFSLPADWSGVVRVQGNIMEGGEGDQHVTAALGVDPEFYGVYARLNDGMHEWLADFQTEQQADDLAMRLQAVDAYAEVNDALRTAKLARLNEDQKRRDPNSTDDDISTAKEARKDAESALMDQMHGQAQPAGLLDSLLQQGPAPLPEALPAAVQQADLATEKTWLAIPYAEKEAAKRAGGKLPDGTKAIDWDKAAKCWYANVGADLGALSKWIPAGDAPRQPSPLAQLAAVRNEFADALRALGAVVTGDHPIMDGKKQRIAVDGDRHPEKSGFYIGYLDGHPAGYINNNRTKGEMRWKSTGVTLSDEEKAKLNADAAVKLAERVAVQEKLHAKTSQAVADLLSIAPAAPADHGYLTRKEVGAGELKIVPATAAGLPPDTLVRIGKTWQESMAIAEAEPNAIVFTAGHLLMTGHDVDGKVSTVQTIREDGVKRFLKDSQKEGSFHAVGGMEALAKAPAIVLGEGFATAKTVSEVMGFATVAAFDNGNLLAAAQALKATFPDKPFIIAGDDDTAQELAGKINYGKLKATEAAEAIGGTAIFPIFAPGEQKSDPKRFTDFNDLATNSALGRDGVARQVGAALATALEKQQSHAQTADRQQSRPQRQVRR